MRRLSMFRDQLNEDRIRNINRLHREMKIYYPEYKDAFGKTDGLFCLEVLRIAPFPEDLLKLGRQIWLEAKLRGRGYSRAGEIIKYASESVGLKDGTEAGKTVTRWFAEKIMELDKKLSETEGELMQKYRQIPHAEKILEISGIGENTLSGILAEMGDITRFDDVKEIQKLSGLNLVLENITDRPRSATGEAKGSDTGCSRRQSRQWPMQRNLRKCLFTIRQEWIIR